MQTLAFNIENKTDFNLLSSLAKRIGIEQIRNSDSELFNFLKDQQIRLELALVLFQSEKITLGRAAHFAGLHQYEFQKELSKRKIPIHYDLVDLEEDLNTLSKF